MCGAKLVPSTVAWSMMVEKLSDVEICTRYCLAIVAGCHDNSAPPLAREAHRPVGVAMWRGGVGRGGVKATRGEQPPATGAAPGPSFALTCQPQTPAP